MSDIVAFLEARIGEDEATARAATPGKWKLWAMSVEADTGGDSDHRKATLVAHTYSEGAHPRTHNATHIARWDPIRVLAECKAKRAIIEKQRYWIDHRNNPPESDEELHRKSRHPAWEYETVVEARKQGYGEPPDGEGWIHNGFERFAYTEETSWRRLLPEPVEIGPYIPVDLRIIASVWSGHPDFDPAWGEA